VIGKQEIDSTEYLLKIRSSVDTRQRECNHLSAAVSSQAERNESIQRALTAQRLLHENLRQDVLQMEAAVHKLAQRNSTMQVELESINHRKDRLEVFLFEY
jgi:predicted  nucleic acid-binding Zn-ribbon protein